MLRDVIEAINDMASPPFRGVMIKSVGLTALVLAVSGFGLDWLVLHYVHVSSGWLAAAISFAVGLGLVVALVLMAAPVASFAASLFIDEIAEIVEREIDPLGPQGRPVPMWESLIFSARFTGLTLVVMLAALVLIFLPGIGFLVWIGANAYLLGRQYFELAAMRFGSAPEAERLRRRFAGPVFLAGLVIAGFVSIPLLNLTTPLFAAALMTRVHKRLAI